MSKVKKLFQNPTLFYMTSAQNVLGKKTVSNR